jgi:betaine-aldehyde dehydrogenase
MSQASRTVKRLHLELGGKAPFIVFDDAHLSAAVQGAVVGSFVNAGQDCTASTRLYIHKKVFDRFAADFLKETKKIKLGVFDNPQTDMGPLISAERRSQVEGFLERAKNVEILCGGDRPSNLKSGFFLNPTVILKAAQNSELVQKEIFGPVVCLLPFKDEAEAVTLANDVEYGLAASVWTLNAQRALRVSSALRFGTVWINDHLPLASETPHGGFNQSGFGKDLSLQALEEFTVVKHVMADMTGDARKPWHYTAFGKK